MAREIKVYGTNGFPPSDICEALRQLGASQYKRQFRIICGATSIAEANRICAEKGLGNKVFQYGWCSPTGNKKELELAGNGGIFILAVDFSEKYYSIEQLKGEA